MPVDHSVLPHCRAGGPFTASVVRETSFATFGCADLPGLLRTCLAQDLSQGGGEGRSHPLFTYN